jgi:hypothetical protein
VNENTPSFSKKTVLLAPLHWGLGHATRCIPIIHELLRLQCNVLVAANGAPKTLLQQEFPQLQYIDSPACNIRYARSRFWLAFGLLLQLPRLLSTIKKENQWLRQTVTDYGIDAVISDNRYGLWHPHIPTVFITHQLQVQTGLRGIGEAMLRKWQYRFINRFTQCWVPDCENPVQSLAGRLSHPGKMPAIPVHYLGALSRFTQQEMPVMCHLLILLSGPEPQRSVFEYQMLHQLNGVKFSTLLVRGLPQDASPLKIKNPNIIILNHLPANDLNKALALSQYVLCRSGYTSVMDLLKLGKKTIMVPTPGQTEQEYLARFLQAQGFITTAQEAGFSLSAALEKAAVFEYVFPPAAHFTQYPAVIQNFVQSL